MKSNLLKHCFITITLFLLSGLAVFNFSSCEKEDLNYYYVNYVIKGPSPYGRFSDWTATTPEGIYSNNDYKRSSWNETFGPLKKGFTCKVKIGDHQGGTPTIEIHVSKNDGPFTLKETVTGTSASYKIDF